MFMMAKMEYIKRHFLVLIVKLFFVSLFILSIIKATIMSSFYWTTAGVNRDDLASYQYFLKEFSIYRPAVVLLIPVIGVFINRKIGWILMQSYFYFLLSNLIYSIKYADFSDKVFIAINIFILSLVLLGILLMNSNTISSVFYGFRKREIVDKNIISSIIGICITLILAMVKADLPY